MAAKSCVSLAESLKVLRLADSTVDVYQVKDFTKYWVVLSSQLPGEGYLHFHKSKSTVQRNSTLYVENLTNMTNISQIDDGKNQYMLKLHYADHLVYILFSSQSTLQKWYKRLRTFLNCYPLFLLKCPQQPHRIGHYILCFNKNKLHVYSTHDGQRVWTWHLGHLRRFSYEPKVPFVEIEPGRSSETGEGNFYFTGKSCKELFDLLQSLSQSGTTHSSQPTTTVVTTENIDISQKAPYLKLLVPSSAEVTPACKLLQNPVVRMPNSLPNSLPGHYNKKPSDHHRKLVSVQSLSSAETSPKNRHYFVRNHSIPEDELQARTNACGSSKAKCIQINGGSTFNAGSPVNGGSLVNGHCSPGGGTQVNGDSLLSHDNQTAHTTTKLTSISERDFEFDHIYDYIDNDSDDDNDYI